MERSPSPLAKQKLTRCPPPPLKSAPTSTDISFPFPSAPRPALPDAGRSVPQEAEGKEQQLAMSTAAVSSSSLNPDAPLFIPAALLQVEDFSPQWWDLVTTTPWFRDHWSREHSELDEMAEELEAAGLLPDDEDLFYDDQAPVIVETAPAADLKTDAVLKALNLTSPKGGDAPRGFREKPRHSEKPTKYAGSPKSAAPRVIHQPR